MDREEVRRMIADRLEELVWAGDVEVLVREDGTFAFEITEQGQVRYDKEFNPF